jgi:DNA-binding XRE family transcriptional regulator
MLYNIATLPKNFDFKLVENELEETDTLGIRIRNLRKLKNLTSKELGDLIGITGAGIICYENDNA